eukprot:1695384-Pleurochrysis_carterae.AAC.1
MVLVKITVKINWSPARAWVAPEAETASDILSADDDDTGSKTEPKSIPENAILSHQNKQPLFRLGGAQTCEIIVHPTLIDQVSEMHDQPTSPCTHSSLRPPLKVERAPRRFTAVSEGFATR